jgi:PAS domain S-box-containing protein
MLTTRTTEANSDTRAKEAVHPRVYLDDLPDGYYEADLDGMITYGNAALVRLLGLPTETVNGESWAALLTPSTAQEAVTLMRRVTEQGTPQMLEVGVYLASGVERILELSIAPLMDTRGNPVGVRGIARDVTARYQRVGLMPILEQVADDISHAAEATAALDLALEGAMLLSNADAGFVGVRDGDHLRLAHTFGEYTLKRLPLEGVIERALKLRRPELLTKIGDDDPALPDTAALMVFPLVARDCALGVLALETSEPSRFTPAMLELMPLLVTRMAAVLDTALLLQSQTLHEGELRALQNQIKELERLKANLIRLSTHDLRNPLSIIKGYMDIMRDDLDGLLEPLQRSFFDAIAQAVQRIDQITSDIVSLGRVQTAPPANPGPVDLAVLVNKAVMDFREESRRRGQTLHMNVPADPVIVHADETDLVEAIRNLLSNAVKFTPQGGRVEIRLTPSDSCVRLDVEDTGIGISEEHQARLFEPFFRVKQEDAAVVGTGLGLYVTRQIVERYGGRIAFKSALKAGSTFSFELPMRVS